MLAMRTRGLRRMFILSAGCVGAIAFAVGMAVALKPVQQHVADAEGAADLAQWAIALGALLLATAVYAACEAMWVRRVQAALAKERTRLLQARRAGNQSGKPVADADGVCSEADATAAGSASTANLDHAHDDVTTADMTHVVVDGSESDAALVAAVVAENEAADASDDAANDAVNDIDLHVTAVEAASRAARHLPKANELPRLPRLVIAPVAPDKDLIRRAKRLDTTPQRLAMEAAILRALGKDSPSELDAPMRAQVRLRAAALAGQPLTAAAKQAVVHQSYLEARLEKHRERAELAALTRDERTPSSSGSWLIAALLHVTLILVFFSLIVSKREEPPHDALIMAHPVLQPREAMSPTSIVPLEKRNEEIENPLETLEDLEQAPEFDNPAVPDLNAPRVEGADIAPQSMMPSPPAFESPYSHLIPTGRIGLTGAPSGSTGPVVGSAQVNLRQLRNDGAGRREALTRHGGSQKTEDAVALGLQWLAAQQDDDGAWHVDDADRADRYFRTGYTAMALLCFLGAGHTHVSGGYRETVQAAVDYLLDEQQPSGKFDNARQGGGDLYNQTVALLALAEIYALTKDQIFREPIEDGLRYLGRAQQRSGGWDYTIHKSDRSDTSITGWAVMAMKSAMLAGIAVDSEMWDGAREWLHEATLDNGEVYYGVTGSPYPLRRGVGMIAVSMLSRLYLGDPVEDPTMRLGFDWIGRNLPSWTKLAMNNSRYGDDHPSELDSTDEYFHTVYYWYYGTMAMFQYTGGVGPQWMAWNNALQKAILPNQITGKTLADEKDNNVSRRLRHDEDDIGSWDAINPYWGTYCGRLYATCMNILNLEIYYRYLPILRDAPGGGSGNPGGSGGPAITPDNPQGDGDDAGPSITVTEASAVLFADATEDAERTLAIEALTDHARSNSKSAIDALLKALLEPILTERFRRQALQALVLAQVKSASQEIIDSYDLAYNAPLRREILAQLGRLGNKTSFDFLVDRLQRGSDSEKGGAQEGLRALTGESLGADPEAWRTWRKLNPNW